MSDTTMELSGFLDMRLKPISEELSASGAGHVLLCFVPSAARMKIVTDRTDLEAALMMRQMAEALFIEAEKREWGKATPGGLILPPH